MGGSAASPYAFQKHTRKLPNEGVMFPVSHEDEIARMRAEMDQAAEGMKELARNVWAFYSEAVEQGFTSSQALQLVTSIIAQRPLEGDDE